jgi:hypothetical protein
MQRNGVLEVLFDARTASKPPKRTKQIEKRYSNAAPNRCPSPIARLP